MRRRRGGREEEQQEDSTTSDRGRGAHEVLAEVGVSEEEGDDGDASDYHHRGGAVSVQLWWPSASSATTAATATSAATQVGEGEGEDDEDGGRLYMVGWWRTAAASPTPSALGGVCEEEASTSSTTSTTTTVVQVCVAAVVRACKTEDVATALQRVLQRNELVQVIADRCKGEPPVVVGTLSAAQAAEREGGAEEDPPDDQLWIQLAHRPDGRVTDDERLHAVQLYLQGSRYTASDLSMQIIRYEPPESDRGHFLTSEPLPLTSKLATAELPSTQTVREQPCTELDTNVHRMNCSWIITHMLNYALAHPDESADMALSTILKEQRKSAGLWSLVCSVIAILIGLSNRWLIVPTLWLLDRSIPFGLTSLLRIKQATAVGRQLDLRLRTLRHCAARWNYLEIFRRNPWHHNPTSRVIELSLANSIWLMLVDFLAGVLFMSIAWTSAEWLAHAISAADYEDMWREPLRSGVIFLMNQPGGVKLNPQLSNALGAVFLYLIDSWTVLTAGLLPYLPSLLRLASLAGLMGLTMALALLSDLMSVFALHIFYFYTVSTRLYAIMLHVLSSLWKLFRGKKRNVLRQRIDSYSYDVDQLLLGTLLFTVIFFLLPTIFGFYLYFALLRLLVLSVNIVFAFLVEGLNHFPIYSIFLSISDPKALPGGISFSARATGREALSRRVSYLICHGRAMPLGALFDQYKSALREVISRYAPQTLLSRFLHGEIMLAV